VSAPVDSGLAGGFPALGNWTSQASVLFAVVAAIWIVIRSRRRSIKLEDLLSGSLAAAMLPTGVVLICCGFDPSMLTSLTGSNIHITTAGLALLYLSLVKLKSFS